MLLNRVARELKIYMMSLINQYLSMYVQEIEQANFKVHVMARISIILYVERVEKYTETNTLVGKIHRKSGSVTTHM